MDLVIEKLLDIVIFICLAMVLPILIILNRFEGGKVFLVKLACFLQGVKRDDRTR